MSDKIFVLWLRTLPECPLNVYSVSLDKARILCRKFHNSKNLVDVDEAKNRWEKAKETVLDEIKTYRRQMPENRAKNLPPELICDILQNLPRAEVEKCRFVNMHWKSIISGEHKRQ